MKNANLVTVLVFIVFIFGLMISDYAEGPNEISVSERRELAQSPELSLDTVFDGDFAEDYATFLQDQVVLRDDFRTIKSLVELKLFLKKENNGVYIVDNNIYDKFYGINQRYIDRSATLINNMIPAIDSDKIYLSIIPSKAHMLNRDKYLLSDQNIIADYLKENGDASYIDMMSLFSDSSENLYYVTDHHWTTLGAIEAYKVLIEAMGYEPVVNYTLEEVTDSYVGSNYGRAALRSIEKDKIHLAHNECLDNMTVCRYESLDSIKCFDSVYFKEKIGGLDPYDVFIGGLGPITVIENPKAQTSEELIVFKDSYSHILAPFLAQHFRRVTLFDLRYVRKELIFDNFDLDGNTVLFIYNTTILNTDPQILN